MNVWLAALLCNLMGYLIGCFNPSYIMARIRGFDIRKAGSGNAGASNAAITMGAKWGILFAVVDIAKAFGAVKLAGLLFPTLPWAWQICASSCILGHMFPVFMGFRGGKGLACLGGSILAYNPWLALFMLLAELVIVFSTDYICFVAISAAIAFPIIHGILDKQVVGPLILALASLPILAKHMHNLARIKNGTEAHFSGLWRRSAELERVKQNLEKQSDAPDVTPEERHE